LQPENTVTKSQFALKPMKSAAADIRKILISFVEKTTTSARRSQRKGSYFSTRLW